PHSNPRAVSFVPYTTLFRSDDPSQILVRQIIGAFDEHTSREISKNTTRAMRESAKQGFWNGATPPLGYRIVEAERRGQKIKKKRSEEHTSELQSHLNLVCRL